ncbi:hypothetical protein SAMN05421644_1079 [Allochromatium warmingii]|uniref:DUF7931 domain-containing protein n=1 Tax=Allochromatium warmingii TaxID=61595 RepID=A0A1H3CVI6_ALLWA|nr:hypothetical protein [Allochromatium warmingii]SDX57564.1 hypothetical protein SAMN05421644_1079 [Allochromatium warmingii]
MSNDVEYLTRTLGDTSGRIQLIGRQAIAAVSTHLVAQARREVLIQDPVLDATIYAQEPFVQAIKRLALERPSYCVRVLISDPRTALQRGHRLIELARRLTSRIAIQRVADDEPDQLEAMLIVDATGYMRRRLVERLEAVADYDDSVLARRWRLEFEQRWERSVADVELRQFVI